MVWTTRMRTKIEKTSSAYRAADSMDQGHYLDLGDFGMSEHGVDEDEAPLLPSI